MNLKNSFENAKRKIKDNAPIIMASAVAIGSAAVVYTMTRKLSIQIDDAFSNQGAPDFELQLSGKEFNKIVSGIPKTVDMIDATLYVVTKDMLKDDLVLPEVIAKS